MYCNVIRPQKCLLCICVFRFGKLTIGKTNIDYLWTECSEFRLPLDDNNGDGGSGKSEFDFDHKYGQVLSRKKTKRSLSNRIDGARKQ